MGNVHNMTPAKLALVNELSLLSEYNPQVKGFKSSEIYRKADVSPKYAKKLLKELEEDGYIEAVKKGKDGRVMSWKILRMSSETYYWQKITSEISAATRKFFKDYNIKAKMQPIYHVEKREE
jgi:CTP-dependent riboflavin kinase